MGNYGGYQPYTTPIPNPSSYLEAQNLAKRAYEQTLARVTASRNQRAAEAGYMYKGKRLVVDPKALYGGLQMMLRGQSQEDQAHHEQLLERGVMGGLANQQRSEDKYQHGYQSAVFGSNLTKDLGGFSDQLQQAKQAYDSSLWQAQRDSAQNAIGAGDFNPALLPNYAQQSQQPPPNVPQSGVANPTPGQTMNPALLEQLRKILGGGGGPWTSQNQFSSIFNRGSGF